MLISYIKAHFPLCIPALWKDAIIWPCPHHWIIKVYSSLRNRSARPGRDISRWDILITQQVYMGEIKGKEILDSTDGQLWAFEWNNRESVDCAGVRVEQHDGKALMTGVGKLHLLYSHTVEFLFAFWHWLLLLLLSLNHGLVFCFWLTCWRFPPFNSLVWE